MQYVAIGKKFCVFQQKLFHSSPYPGKNFICKVGYADKCYRWVCRDGFKGENCDEGMAHQVDFVVFYVSMC